MDRTNNLVNHNQNTSFGMLNALHIPVDGHTQTLIEADLRATIEAGTNCFHFGRAWAQQENVGTGEGGNDVEVFQHTRLDGVRSRVNHKIVVDINSGTFLQYSALVPLSNARQHG